MHISLFFFSELLYNQNCSWAVLCSRSLCLFKTHFNFFRCSNNAILSQFRLVRFFFFFFFSFSFSFDLIWSSLFLREPCFDSQSRLQPSGDKEKFREKKVERMKIVNRFLTLFPTMIAFCKEKQIKLKSIFE